MSELPVGWVRTPCDTNQCVEVHPFPFPTEGNGMVFIRTSSARERLVITTMDEWVAFVGAVKAGAFDKTLPG